jgi:thymidylate kinase
MIQSTNGVVASLEGIRGSGKSYILSRLREALQGVPVTFVEEVEDRGSCDLDQSIVTLLRKHSAGDHFFRSGHPHTETLLLMALKAYDGEERITPALSAGTIIIEDGGIHTFAVYQALLFDPSDPKKQLEAANMLYRLACQWRPPSDVTFLLEEEFATALERTQQRSASSYTPKEQAFLRAAASLYERYVEQPEHQNIIRLDRRRMEIEEIVQIIETTVMQRYRGLPPSV